MADAMRVTKYMYKRTPLAAHSSYGELSYALTFAAFRPPFSFISYTSSCTVHSNFTKY